MNNNFKTRKSIISSIISLLMLFSIFSVQVMAVDTDITENIIQEASAPKAGVSIIKSTANLYRNSNISDSLGHLQSGTTINITESDWNNRSGGYVKVTVGTHVHDTNPGLLNGQTGYVSTSALGTVTWHEINSIPLDKQ